MSYSDFIARKLDTPPCHGIAIAPADTHDMLYPFQRDIVSRALSVGRYAMFCDTGLGKTAMQLVWASHVMEHGGRVLILAPLAVAEQTSREGRRFGVDARYRREDCGDAITIANYEMLGAFDPSEFAGVVLDESSILKSYTGATRNAIVDAFRNTPYRLACTATPAPNDFTELGNHAEFLGVKTRVEMLSEFFVHDGGSTSDWRIKGHARIPFWEWIGSWASVVRMPSDLGYEDAGFALPGLCEHFHVIELDLRIARDAGLLFVPDAVTLSDQRDVRRSTMDDRVSMAASLAEGNDPVLVWCELNAEADAVTAAIPGAVQVAGSDSINVKVDGLLGFADGRHRVLVTKPKIAGFGMNWQHCSRMIFMGISNSFEQTYQAIRRCWRYGQTKPVDVHYICTNADSRIAQNYRRKAHEHAEMSAAMAGVTGKCSKRWNDYSPHVRMEIPKWLK